MNIIVVCSNMNTVIVRWNCSSLLSSYWAPGCALFPKAEPGGLRGSWRAGWAIMPDAPTCHERVTSCWGIRYK